jgi:hypothetical protein
MIYQVIQYIDQGNLPSPQQLLILQARGFKHLLNISGIDLQQLYSPQQLANFTLQQFYFRDVFSMGMTLQFEQIEQINSAVYYTQTTEAERMQFFAAVQQLIDWLNEKIPTYVFCQQGIGRSPCVLAAALTHCYQPQAHELFKIIKFLNSNALITANSYAAIQWFQQQIALNHG